MKKKPKPAKVPTIKGKLTTARLAECGNNRIGSWEIRLEDSNGRTVVIIMVEDADLARALAQTGWIDVEAQIWDRLRR